MAGDTAAVEVRLGEIAGVTRGRAYRSADLESSRTALVTLKSFERGGGYRKGGLKAYAGPFHATQRVTPGTLVVALTDVTQAAEVIGRPALIGGGEQSFDVLVASQDVAIIRPLAARCETRYLYYHLLGVNYRNHVVGRATGTTVLHLAAEDVLDYRMELPPLPEQRAIAHVLGAIDDKIDLNRRMAATLEDMARALFTSWFVRFDPVRAKMAGQPTGLPPHVEALFPDALVDSELGEVPEGWAVGPISGLMQLTRGRPYRSAQLAPSRVALVTLKSFNRGGTYRDDGLKPYIGPFDPGQEVTGGDLVAALTDVTQAADLIGRPALVRRNPDFDTLVASQDVAVLRARLAPGAQAFVYHVMLTKTYSDYVVGCATGTTVLHLASRDIMGYQISTPDAAVLEAFSSLADTYRVRADQAHEDNATLSALRDALLPKLVSGELRIPDPEAFLRRAGLDAAA
jgi:type I restriction enzyme S subunit